MMFGFILNLIAVSAVLGITGGAAFAFRRLVLRGREGVMYPFWVILLVIIMLPLRLPIFQSEILTAHTDTSVGIEVSDTVRPDGTDTAQPDADITVNGKAHPSVNPLVMRLRRFAAASVEYADEASLGLFVIWLSGMMFSFMGALSSNKKTVKLLKEASSVCTDRRVLGIIHSTKKQLGIRRAVSVRIFDTEMPSSPCVCGILHPTLYVESQCLTMDDKPLKCVILHELTHIRRFDTVIKLFCIFAASVHWFNPMSYRIRRAVTEDCELSCDYSVMKAFGTSVSSAYMSAILDFAARYSEKIRAVCGEGYGMSLFTDSSASAVFLKRRYTNMKNFRKRRPVYVITVIMAIICLAVNTLTVSSCSGITTDDLGSAIELTPPIDIMVRAYYGLGPDDYITPDHVDGITSVTAESKTLSDGRTVVRFAVNGDDRFTSPLSPLTKCNFMEKTVFPKLEHYCTAINDEKPLFKFKAFITVRDINAPDITEFAKSELIAQIPDIEKLGKLYELDPYASEREINIIYTWFAESGLLDAWTLASDELNVSSFAYFENLREATFVGITPTGYDFPAGVTLTVTE